VCFLQNSEIPDNFKAQGIQQARKKLRYERMPDIEKQAYRRHIENKRVEMAVLETAEQKGIREGVKQTAKNFKALGVSVEIIIQATGLTQEEIEKL